ncbi:MAG: hypothetical protein ACOC3V_04525 [bacterium]
MDILKTFLSLTDYTYTLGDEDQLLDRLPSNVEKDSVGNYFLKIGESETMFCSHLDTAAHKKEKVEHDVFTTKGGDIGVGTDLTTLLGADDKAGVVIMLNMIENNIPGLYYFFIGEESGLVGSKGALRAYSNVFSKYKRCISFDRRDYGSVITKQMGRSCCSGDFANSLIKELAKGGMLFKQDPTGIYTDSAVFAGIIPECTNLSVGYFNEHSVNEVQNITYLEELANAVLLVDWEKLPTKRETIVEDSPRPKRRPKRKGDKDDDELLELFFDVDELLEDYIDMYCFNFNSFEPEKEMIYIDYDDDARRLSVYIHEDGTISVGKDTFNSLIELHEALKYYYSEDDNDLEYVDDEDDKDDIPYWGDDIKSGEDLDDIIYDDYDFEKDINIPDFIHDVLSLSYEKDRNYLTVNEINNLLEKRKKDIESFIIWVFYTGRGDFNEYGLKWDTDNNRLLIDDIEND